MHLYEMNHAMLAALLPQGVAALRTPFQTLSWDLQGSTLQLKLIGVAPRRDLLILQLSHLVPHGKQMRLEPRMRLYLFPPGSTRDLERLPTSSSGKGRLILERLAFTPKRAGCPRPSWSYDLRARVNARTRERRESLDTFLAIFLALSLFHRST